MKKWECWCNSSYLSINQSIQIPPRRKIRNWSALTCGAYFVLYVTVTNPMYESFGIGIVHIVLLIDVYEVHHNSSTFFMNLKIRSKLSMPHDTLMLFVSKFLKGDNFLLLLTGSELSQAYQWLNMNNGKLLTVGSDKANYVNSQYTKYRLKPSTMGWVNADASSLPHYAVTSQ